MHLLDGSAIRRMASALSILINLEICLSLHCDDRRPSFVLSLFLLHLMHLPRRTLQERVDLLALDIILSQDCVQLNQQEVQASING